MLAVVLPDGQVSQVDANPTLLLYWPTSQRAQEFGSVPFLPEGHLHPNRVLAPVTPPVIVPDGQVSQAALELATLYKFTRQLTQVPSVAHGPPVQPVHQLLMSKEGPDHVPLFSLHAILAFILELQS